MKKRFHDKKAGIISLVILVIVSMIEVLFRLGCMRQSLITTSNAGEPLASAIFAIIIMILSAKKQDRACYICYGAWIACFVLNQFLGLPGMIAKIVANASSIGVTSIIVRAIIMLCIVAIGALIVEYINDGTIYNRAFNILCFIAVLLLFLDIIHNICMIAIGTPPAGVELSDFKKNMMLLVFNNLHYIILVFLFTIFAYDSAKAQLKKADLTK